MFVRSILLLMLGAMIALVPYSFGHALSNHHVGPVIVGAVALVVALGLGFLLTRSRAPRDAHDRH